MVVDEAHVIESWKDQFRKDYGELQMLRIIVGTEIPWLALTATCSTLVQSQNSSVLSTMIGRRQEDEKTCSGSIDGDVLTVRRQSGFCPPIERITPRELSIS
jgi:hypothetical protein